MSKINNIDENIKKLNELREINKPILKAYEKTISPLENINLKGLVDSSSYKSFNTKEKANSVSTNDFIKNANNQVLINILSPQIEENEKLKRKYKTALLVMLGAFLIFQFGAVVYFTNKILSFVISENADIEAVKALLTFIGAYITSVVVELIAILKYIVKNVFDTSMVELAKLFRDEYADNNIDSNKKTNNT